MQPSRADGSLWKSGGGESRGSSLDVGSNSNAALKRRSSTSAQAAPSCSVVPTGLGFHWLVLPPDLRPGLYSVVAPRLARVPLLSNSCGVEAETPWCDRLLPTLREKHAKDGAPTASFLPVRSKAWPPASSDQGRDVSCTLASLAGRTLRLRSGQANASAPTRPSSTKALFQQDRFQHRRWKPIPPVSRLQVRKLHFS